MITGDGKITVFSFDYLIIKIHFYYDLKFECSEGE